MKGYFIKKFKDKTLEFRREYRNEKDIWYLLATGLKENQLKFRMHNENKNMELWELVFQCGF